MRSEAAATAAAVGKRRLGLRTAGAVLETAAVLALLAYLGCARPHVADAPGRAPVRIHLGSIPTEGPPEPPLGEAHALLALAQTVPLEDDRPRPIEIQWFNEFPSGTASLNKLLYDPAARRLRHSTSKSVRAYVYDRVTPEKLKRLATSGARTVRKLTTQDCPMSRM